MNQAALLGDAVALAAALYPWEAVEAAEAALCPGEAAEAALYPEEGAEPPCQVEKYFEAWEVLAALLSQSTSVGCK